MALPDHVHVLGIKFVVEQPAKFKAKNQLGESCNHKRTISVKKGESPDLQESILLHEIIHMILHNSGQAEKLDPEQEEGIVIALENGLHQLYKRR